MLRDLRHWASHVHVNDVGAHAFDDLRGVSHLDGIAPENLDRNRPLLLGVFRVLQRAADAADQPFGRDHFGHDQAAAALSLHEAAKRGVCHARHRRHHKRRGQLDGANLHTRLIGANISGVDFDADRLPNQIDGQYQTRLFALPHEAADHAR